MIKKCRLNFISINFLKFWLPISRSFKLWSCFSMGISIVYISLGIHIIKKLSFHSKKIGFYNQQIHDYLWLFVIYYYYWLFMQLCFTFSCACNHITTNLWLMFYPFFHLDDFSHGFHPRIPIYVPNVVKWVATLWDSKFILHILGCMGL